MDKILTGLIVKAISGFYYVETAEMLYECKARGIFRKKGISPFVGDSVNISISADGKGMIDEILPRKNSIIRPPLANLDRLFIISSVAEPSPSTVIIDKITAVAESKNIQPIVIFTKSDLADCSKLLEIYQKSGITALSYSIKTGEGKENIISLLENKISALHTTRHSELYKINGGYVADTPGFSTVDIERYEMIELEKIQYCFPEFDDYICRCQFTGCSHTVEKGCAVLQAVADGKIAKSRHESYQFMYNEVKAIPKWR